PALWATLPPPQLPSWLRRRLIHIYDEAIVQAMETAHLSPAPTDLTVRDSSQTQAWAVTLGAEHLPTGSLRLPASGQLTDLPGYAEGAWWVQDAAAAIPVRALAPQKGEQILDLCAAPGGKSMQLAASGAKVTALDSSATRMARVQENLARTGLHAHCVVADALTWSNARTFDAVLLDAPCSATGTVRRHPDLPHVKGGKGLHDVFELQSRMIDAALSFLKPGGRLTYCTCSLLTEEGELQAKTAIERHGLLDETPAPEDLGLPTTSRVPTGGLRLRPDFWPERGGMDGFFVAVLRKSENGGPNTG
ncbi:MAG: RsmB/NOP family class I SAM-dependent RNA methyltransferase, partial [Pseudomonadota bacterium]